MTWRARDRDGVGATARASARSLAFDSFQPEIGESVWAQTRARPAVRGRGVRPGAERAYEKAYTLDRSRGDIRNRLADVALRAPAICGGVPAGGAGQRCCANASRPPISTARDGSGSPRPGRWFCGPSRPSSQVVLERFERDPATGRRNAKTVALDRGSAPPMTSTPGSYRLVLDGPGWRARRLPVRGRFAVSKSSIDLNATARRRRSPKASPTSRPASSGSATPTSSCGRSFSTRFRSIAAGRGAYIIAQHETTYGRVDRVPERAAGGGARAARARRVVDQARLAPLRCRLRDAAGWQLDLPADGRSGTRRAPAADRLRRAEAERATGLAAFPGLRASRRSTRSAISPGCATPSAFPARACARRSNGSAPRAAPTTGCFRTATSSRPRTRTSISTYGRVDSAYGPDMVGLTPGFAQPVRRRRSRGKRVRVRRVSSQKHGEIVIRGGAYYFNAVDLPQHQPEPSSRRRFVT